MKHASKKVYTCATQGGTLSAQSVSSRAARSPKWYGKMPALVSLDKTITFEAKTAFAILALGAFHDNTSTLGLRELGRLMDRSLSSAKRYVHELVKAGHLLREKSANGKRAVYVLTSPAFGDKSSHLDGTLPKRSATLKPCDKCGLPCKPQKMTGWCKKCLEMAREDRRQSGIRKMERAKLAV
jgi:DNA-binding MarR family transcriptional regulator